MRFLIIIFCITMLEVNADILFIDINKNPEEIKHARIAAQKNNEKVIVIPEISFTDKARQAVIEQRLRAIIIQMRSLSFGNSRYRELDSELNKLDVERYQIIKRNAISKDKIKSALIEAKKNGKVISSLVISGHDGNNHFFGEMGDLRTDELGDIFSEFPEIANSIETVFLAGCYTTAPGLLETQYKNYFPYLKILAGYNEAAPLGSRPAGHNYILNLLSNRKRLMSENGSANTGTIVKSIIPNELAGNASICLPNGIFATKKSVLDLNEIWKKCDSLNEKLEQLYPIFVCYDQGNEGCESLPSNTHSSELRNLYNLIQEMKPCSYKPDFSFSANIDPEQLIRLIYFNNVKNSFVSKYKLQIEQLTSLMEKFGVPSDLIDAFKNLKDLNRRESNKLVEDLSKFIHEAWQSLTNGAVNIDREQLAILKSLIQPISEMRNILNNLVPGCIPFSWVDGSKDESECFAERYGLKDFNRIFTNIDEEVFSLKREIIHKRYSFADFMSIDFRLDNKDQVVSDHAVASSLLKLVHERRDLESDHIELELKINNCKKNNCDSGFLAELNKKFQENQRKLNELNPLAKLDVQKLVDDRQKFFAAAYSLLSINEDEISELEKRIENRKISKTDNERDVSFDQNTELEKKLKEAIQRKEYIELMHRQLSGDESSSVDNEKMKQIFQDRILDVRSKILKKNYDKLEYAYSMYIECENYCTIDQLNYRKRELEFAREEYIRYYLENQADFGI